MKILILASNPRKDLNLDREIRDLKEVIQRSHNRQQFQVEDALAVRVGDLQELLLQPPRPQIVHFCGHGSGEQGLVFESDDGKEQRVRTEALSDLFRLFSKDVGCVLLNACYSEAQANAIVNHIDYVIGMNQAIQDEAAIAFSKGFYRALGYNCSIEQAFEFGKNAIQLEISGSSRILRSAATEQERKAEVIDAVTHTVIPEHLKPVLLRKPTLTQNSNQIILGSTQPITPATREAIQLVVADDLIQEDPKQQYREKVREFLSDRKLSKIEEIRLEQLRKNLELSVEAANEILAEEQKPIQQARDDYQEMLIRLIEAGHYPFDPETEAELQKFCQELGLTEEEVEAIAKPILEAAEEEYQEKLKQQEQQKQQEYQAKLQRYQQEFRKAIDSQYPIDSAVRNQLKHLQQELGLSDAAVAEIEAPITAPKEVAYQQQLEEQRERERQQQLEEQRRQEEAKRRPPMRLFEFRVPTIQAGSRTIEKLGLFGKKTETVTILNVIYQRGQAEYFVENLGNGVALEMVAIPDGSFMMGSPSEELGRWETESPQHRVTVLPFLIGKFAVTQAQWKAVAAMPKVNQDLNADPSRFKSDRRPVECVSWHEAVEFCDRLSQTTGRPYRLPNEAEWEYACRARTLTPFYCGATITTDLANYNGNFTYGSGTKGRCRQQTVEVGSFPANAFGLYDMHGNVWEWCLDHWHENYQGSPIDGSAWIQGGDSDRRLMRGGSWYVNPRLCRSAFRVRTAPGVRNANISFRVVCSAA